MIINIKNKEGELVFETDNIVDKEKKTIAHAIIRKVANLEIISEALLFANQAHRATLEELLVSCEDAKVVEEESN